MKKILTFILFLSALSSGTIYAADGDPVLLPGSSAITTVGTITAGTWQGAVIDGAYITEADPKVGTLTNSYIPSWASGLSMLIDSPIITDGSNVSFGGATLNTKIQAFTATGLYPIHAYGYNQPNGVAIGSTTTSIGAIQGYNNAFSVTNDIAFQPDGGNVNLPQLTASYAVFTDASKNLVSKSTSDVQSFLGLGSSAYAATTDYDAAGTASTAVSNHAALLTGVHGLNITAGKTLTVELDSAINQDLTTDAGPTFTTALLTNLTDGYIPYHVSDAVGLANGPIWTDGTKVGIGATSPVTKLDIDKIGGAASATYATTVTNSALAISYTAGTDTRLLSGIGSVTYAWMQVQNANNAAYNLSLQPIGGNVGIGTTAPQSLLSLSIAGAKVLGSSTGALTFMTNDASYTGTITDGVTGKIDSISESPLGSTYGLGFFTGTIGSAGFGERVRITNQGNVGIGTTNPGTIFTLGGTPVISVDTVNTADNKKLILVGGGSASSIRGGRIELSGNEVTATRGDVVLIAGKGDAGTDGGQISFLTGVDTETEQMTILSSGNVGIGTTAPQSLLSLSIAGAKVLGSSTGALTFMTNDASYTGTITDGVTGKIDSISESPLGSTYGLGFFTGTIGSAGFGERVRITNQGNVGIGTTAPDVHIHEYSALSPGLAVERSTTGNKYIQWKNTLGSYYAGITSSNNFSIGTNADIAASAFLTIGPTGGVVVGTGSDPGAGNLVASHIGLNGAPTDKTIIQAYAGDIGLYAAQFYGYGNTAGLALGVTATGKGAIQGYDRDFGTTNDVVLQPEGGNLYIGSQLISYGANDSGGTGYRVLRIPN